jgi:hypothetical protein
LEDVRVITDLRDHPPPKVNARPLASQVRGAHTVLVMAIENGNEAVRQLEIFSQQYWLTRGLRHLRRQRSK